MTETKLTDNAPHRFSLLGIIGGLMVAENLGDVHDELNQNDLDSPIGWDRAITAYRKADK